MWSDAADKAKPKSIAGCEQSQAGPLVFLLEYIVELLHRCFNQDDKLVAECRRSAFIRMRPA